MTEMRAPPGDVRSWEDLAAEARSARERAYAPYSRFAVGAALEAEDGRVFAGCNVESASYPAGTCAERVALGCAVVAGARAFRRLVVATVGPDPAAPCGMCRQALAEFGLGLDIMSVGTNGTTRWRLGDLLPASFGSEHLASAPEVGS